MSEPRNGDTRFQIDLQQLGDAVQSVGTQAALLKELVGSMQANLRFIAEARPTPASVGFKPVEQRFGDAAEQLSDLLDEINSRLEQAHRDHAAAEHTDVGDTGGRKQAPMAEADEDHGAAPSAEPETASSYINLLISQVDELGSLLEGVGSTLCTLRLGWAGRTADEAQQLDDGWTSVLTQLYGTRLTPQDGVVNVMVCGLVEVADGCGRTAQQLQQLWQWFYDHLQSAAQLSSSRLRTSVRTVGSDPAKVENPADVENANNAENPNDTAAVEGHTDRAARGLRHRGRHTGY